MPGNPRSKSSVAIPVRVSTGHVTRPVNPPINLPPPSAHRPPVNVPKPIKQILRRQPKVQRKQLPEAQRRKIMWASVAAIMVIVVAGWALTFQKQIKFGSNNGIFGDLKNAFNKFSIKTKTPPVQSQEIRDLTEQIFPQFK